MKSLLILVVLLLLSVVATTNNGQLSCECGWTNSQKRIIGGDKTLPNQYPWMASLQSDSEHFCGASIITHWHALTAAHCLWQRNANSIRLVVGAHNLKSKNGREVEVPIAKLIMHERFNYTLNDIGLLVTVRMIPFSITIGPVCMPTEPLNLGYKSIKVTGWRITSIYGSSTSDVLLENDLIVTTKQNCYNWLNEAKILKNYQLDQKVCTFVPYSEQCLGDYGSPLVWLDPDTDRYTQAALLSHTPIHCSIWYPSIKTDVTTYIDWINHNIQVTKPGVKVCSKF